MVSIKPPILLVVFVLALGGGVLAMETDQFTTPLMPLSDIGAALSRKIAEIIESDHSGSDPELAVIRWFGANVLQSRLVGWVKQIPATEGAVSFRPNGAASIFGRTFSPVPASFVFDSPTVRVYGFYMGTDKIDHFFQQGHEYYERVMAAQSPGAGPGTAIAAAVARGVRQEHTFFGTLVSGIYSNADLAANFAGMKFYLNLRQPVRIGDRNWPPLLERSTNSWRVRSDVARDDLLRRFISDHLDESMNPSRYRFSRESIRSRVRERCATWLGFYADRRAFVTRAGMGFATTWFGEDYGYWLPPADEVSIATECK